jgi:hypothetical protein
MKSQLKADTLPLAIIISVVMLLIVMGVLLLWEIDFLHFSQRNFIKQQQADIKSTFTFYNNYPSIIGEQDSAFVQLYDSIASSQMLIERRQWGLYELVSVSSPNRKSHQTCFAGLDSVSENCFNFYYKENKSALTFTGKTDIYGRVALPTTGIIYGQMKSIFFSGKKIENSQVSKSDEKLPEPNNQTKKYIENLFAEQAGNELITSDSIYLPFYNNQTKNLYAKSNELTDLVIKGKIILTGDEINISAECKLSDIIIVARKITINKNFEGSVQIFSRDTVIVEENVKMNYPSGIYSQNYIKIGDNSQINGYVIVENAEKTDVKKANYVQSRLAKVRGLLYINGIAQIQGIVSGSAYLSRAVFYSPQGYYTDMIYDTTVLENAEMAYPLWFNNTQKRKTIKWLK